MLRYTTPSRRLAVLSSKIDTPVRCIHVLRKGDAHRTSFSFVFSYGHVPKLLACCYRRLVARNATTPNFGTPPYVYPRPSPLAPLQLHQPGDVRSCRGIMTRILFGGARSNLLEGTGTPCDSSQSPDTWEFCINQGRPCHRPHKNLPGDFKSLSHCTVLPKWLGSSWVCRHPPLNNWPCWGESLSARSFSHTPRSISLSAGCGQEMSPAT